MKRTFLEKPIRYATLICGLSLAANISLSHGQAWKLYAVTGQQGDDTPADAGPGFKWPDHTLFEVNTSTAAMTKLFTMTFINDSTAIGFNPQNNLIYHTGGSESYSNDPGRDGHDQGGPTIDGVGYQDSQYMETVDPLTAVATAIFNSAPCPNPDPTLPCFGLAAPRPTWVRPVEQRTSEQTETEFRERGENEYHAARGMAWSAEEELFYLADEFGIFKMTPVGESTFLARPAFPVDGKVDEAKGIEFVVTTTLLVGHRDGASDPNNPVGDDGWIMKINPDTGEVIGQLKLAYPEGGGEPASVFGGLLGMAQHPVTGVLYGIRKTGAPIDRELVTINPETGATKLIGNMGMHMASISFARNDASSPWRLIGITGQQSSDELEGAAFKYPDNTLYEINTSNGSITKLFRATWIPDSHSIGFNPVSNLLFHSGGAAAYRDDPARTGHDQGGPDIPGLAFQDNYYVEAINLATSQATAILNANPCPNPDPENRLPCFGLTAPRPPWALPEERRTFDQTDSSFRQRGPDEYSALRGMAWSAQKGLFYVSDGEGIFTLSTTGESKFIGRPAFPVDGKNDVAKAIALVLTTNLLVGHRNGASDPNNPVGDDGWIMHINPETGEVIGQIKLLFPEGGGEPAGVFGGLLGLAQHPTTRVLYGVRKTSESFERELVSINPETGATTLIGNLGMHVASVTFAQSGTAGSDINLSVTGQTEGSITISWTGGSGKFLVQKKVDLGAVAWFDVLTTTERTATVPKDGQAGFFRVAGSYTGPDVTPLTAYLSGQGSKPAVTTPATGVANLSVTADKLNYLITYQDLGSDANAAHIHGPGDSQTPSAGVIVPFTAPAGRTGSISGFANITATVRDQILAGDGYVNIHTANNAGGEIRGQVMRTVYTATLNGANERPDPVTTTGTGTAKITILGRELKYEVSWSNLTQPATAGHIHGRSDAEGTASVLQGFTGITGNSGSATGVVQASVATLDAIVDGMAYVNIHSSVNNGAGEIRGQLAPQP